MCVEPVLEGFQTWMQEEVEYLDEREELTTPDSTDLGETPWVKYHLPQVLQGTLWSRNFLIIVYQEQNWTRLQALLSAMEDKVLPSYFRTLDALHKVRSYPRYIEGVGSGVVRIQRQAAQARMSSSKTNGNKKKKKNNNNKKTHKKVQKQGMKEDDEGRCKERSGSIISETETATEDEGDDDMTVDDEDDMTMDDDGDGDGEEGEKQSQQSQQSQSRDGEQESVCSEVEEDESSSESRSDGDDGSDEEDDEDSY